MYTYLSGYYLQAGPNKLFNGLTTNNCGKVGQGNGKEYAN